MRCFVAKSSTSGQGRPRGVPNKLNADLRAMILGALSEAGGQEYLARQANENPTAFLTLIGKSPAPPNGRRGRCATGHPLHMG